MGTIVDLTNLVTRLIDSVQDRKFAGELREIQRMISNLQSEQAVLHERNISLMRENEDLRKSILSLQMKEAQPQQPIRNDKLDETSTKILIAIANERKLTRDMVYYRFGLSKAKGDYYFDGLLELKFIHMTHGQMGVGMFYSTTAAGRKYLAENNLL